MRGQGASQSAIARKLGVHRSTVKRELDRNSKEGNYRAKEAQMLAMSRKYISGVVAELFNSHKPPRVLLSRPSFNSTNKQASKRLQIRRYKSRGKQFRLKRYQFYMPRPDNREYKLHPNKRRKHRYYKWKSKYEKLYRFRDNEIAEKNRTPRSRQDFLRYFSESISPGLRFRKRRHLAFRKRRRARFEMLRNRNERDMRELEYQWFEIRNKEAIAKLKEEVKNKRQAGQTQKPREPQEQIQIQAQEQPVFFLIWFQQEPRFRQGSRGWSGFG